MKKSTLLLLVGLLLSGSCFAERLLSATFTGQPTLLLKDGNIQSCGVRFVGFEAPINPSNPKESIWFSDASFMLDRGGFGMVKAILKKSTIGAINTGGKQTVQTFKTFWIKAPNADATQPINGKVIDGENEGSKLYIADAIGVMNLYKAISEHKPIQLGFKFVDSNDFAFYGEVALSEKEFEQVRSCMDELIGLMQKDLEKVRSD